MNGKNKFAGEESHINNYMPTLTKSKKESGQGNAGKKC